ncbi:hypothetical protein MASR2M48_29680 [Spirochaetota bacterium]
MYTTPEAFEAVLNAINEDGMETDGAEISMVPEIYVAIWQGFRCQDTETH